MPDTFFYSQLLKLHFYVDVSQMAVRNYPVAQALYLKYCRDHNRETLRDIYVQEDDYNAQAACFIRESYDPKVNGSYSRTVFSQVPVDFEVQCL
jgi:hypothetical protein